MKDLLEGWWIIFAAFFAGYLLGGTWQIGLGAVALQFVFASNTSSLLTAIAQMVKYTANKK